MTRLLPIRQAYARHGYSYREGRSIPTTFMYADADHRQFIAWVHGLLPHGWLYEARDHGCMYQMNVAHDRTEMAA